MENGRILENFTRLADRGENIFVRYPYIPGMNDDQVEKIAEFLHRWQQIEAELLPYHKLGNSKYRALEDRSAKGRGGNAEKEVWIPVIRLEREVYEYGEDEGIAVIPAAD